MAWARKTCSQCGDEHPFWFLDLGVCLYCQEVNDGVEAVVKLWPCPKCGTRMWSCTLTKSAGGGKPRCCWMFPAPWELKARQSTLQE